MTQFDISLEDAADLTANYRDQFDSETPYIKAELFDKTAIQSVLDQTDCTGMRIYYGLKADSTPCLVLVGTDTSGNDLYNGIILEHGSVCPPTCSANNPLNT